MFDELKEHKHVFIIELILGVATIIYMVALNYYNQTILSEIGNGRIDFTMAIKILKFPNCSTYLIWGVINVFILLLFTWIIKKLLPLAVFGIVLIINIVLIIILWKLLWNPIIRALLIALFSLFAIAFSQDN